MLFIWNVVPVDNVAGSAGGGGFSTTRAVFDVSDTTRFFDDGKSSSILQFFKRIQIKRS